MQFTQVHKGFYRLNKTIKIINYSIKFYTILTLSIPQN